MWGALAFISIITVLSIVVIPLWIFLHAIVISSSFVITFIEIFYGSLNRPKFSDELHKILMSSKFDRMEVQMPLWEVKRRASKAYLGIASKTGRVIFIESVGFVDGYDIIARAICNQQGFIPVTIFSLKNAKIHLIKSFGISITPRVITNLFKGEYIKC